MLPAHHSTEMSSAGLPEETVVVEVVVIHYWHIAE